jgi:hypothetical protein
MALKKYYDYIATLGMIMMGLILFIITAISFNKVDNGCENSKIHSSLTAILALGAGLITAGIGFWVCIGSTESCYGSNEHSEQSAEIYFGLMSIISIGLITSCSIILHELGKKSDESQKKLCGGSDLKNAVIAILSLSVITFIASIGGGYFAAFGIPASLRNKGEVKKDSGGFWGFGGVGGFGGFGG